MRKITFYDLYSHLGAWGFLNWIPDKMYLRIQFRLKLHRKLHLNDPKTLNEKLQWLKLNDRNPIYSEFVDKCKVRSHIEKALGKEYLIPLLGVWEKPEDIDFEQLPNEFVLKCNHDSGGVMICKDKARLNVHKVREILNKRLHRTYCWGNREWPYKNVHPMVLAEAYLKDNQEESSLTDYKFYCFSGKPDCVLACVDRRPGDAKFIYFDRSWNRLEYNYQTEEEKNREVPKPSNLEKMFDIAEKIAGYVGSPFLRVDLYNIDTRIYFGEATFYPHSGMDATLKPEIDSYFGSKVILPEDSREENGRYRAK